MRKVPFLSLEAVNAPLHDQLRQALHGILDSGWYIRGASGERFEQAFAQYCEARHAIGVGNGLDAITLILRAYQVLGLMAPGDEILVPAHTYIASILAISHASLTPVLIEPCEDTYTIDPQLVECAITPRTKALLAVHLYGQCADMEPLRQIAGRHRLLLIEDAAQAHGATYRQSRAGGLGDAAAFSFYPTKNLGGLGDGGAVVTSDGRLAQCVRELANYGSRQKYEHVMQGVNSRLDEMQAAVLSVKLTTLDTDNGKRQAIAQRYLAEIHNPRVRLPVVATYGTHVWHLFVVRVADRESFMDFLRERGIETAVHYPIPPHHQTAYEGCFRQSLPLTEQLHREVVSLPISPVLSADDVQQVIDGVNAYA